MIWLIALLALAAAGTASGGSSPNTGGGGGVPGGDSEVRKQAARAMVHADWGTFLSAVAYHESRFNPNVGFGRLELADVPGWVKLNQTPEKMARNESLAGLKAFDRNVTRADGTPGQLAACTYDRARYAYSGGWYGILPANGLVSAFRGTDGVCLDPWMVFDPWVSTLMAIGFAKGLRGWKSFRRSPQSWLALNRGWKNPSKMDDASAMAKTDERFRKALRAMGVPESFADRKVVALPESWHAWTFYNNGGAVA